MKVPKLAIVLRGRPDRNNKQLLYLRYAFAGKSYWISLGVSVHPDHWDAKKEVVKARDVTSAKINQLTASVKFKANDWAISMLIGGQVPTFESYKESMGPAQPGPNERYSKDLVYLTIDHLIQEKSVSEATFRAYRAAVNHFFAQTQITYLDELTTDVVLKYRRAVVSGKNENLANQYLRNLKVVLRHVARRNKVVLPDPFEGVEINISRMSEKKSLTLQEYEALVKCYNGTKDKSEKEVLRRFLVLCKGLRFSDTHRFTRDDLQEFVRGNQKVFYFNRAAQKTDVAGVVIFLENDLHLLQFDARGKLFETIGVAKYNKDLKRISRKITGREITSHYGRHYAADQMINSGHDIEDVQIILGIKDRNIARVYAKRKVESTLGKILDNYEKNKPDPPD